MTPVSNHKGADPRMQQEGEQHSRPEQPDGSEGVSQSHPDPPGTVRRPTLTEVNSRAARLLELLQMIPGPLRSAVDRSRHMLSIPEQWFRTTTARIYEPQYRRFAARMKVLDPLLLKAFARADISVLLRHPRTTSRVIAEFAKGKYDLASGETELLAEVISLPRLVAVAAEFLRGRPEGWTNQSASARNESGGIRFCSHHVPCRYQGGVLRSDCALTAVRDDRATGRLLSCPTLVPERDSVGCPSRSVEPGVSTTRSVVFGEDSAAPAGGGASPQEDQQETERATDSDEGQLSSAHGQGISGPRSIFS